MFFNCFELSKERLPARQKSIDWFIYEGNTNIKWVKYNPIDVIVCSLFVNQKI